jgi:hypothetical protein
MRRRNLIINAALAVAVVVIATIAYFTVHQRGQHVVEFL